MFEEAVLTAAWHPDRGEWVALEPCDLVDPDLRDALDGLAADYATRGLPFDVEEVPAGPELARVLAAFDDATADGYDLVEAAAGLAGLASWVAAREARVLARLAARLELRPATTGFRSVNPITNTAVEVAGRCQLTTKQAENQVGHAIQLVEDFPDSWAALEAGLIDLRRARVITDELGGQQPAVRARVEAAVLPRAPFMDAVALRKLIKRLLHELAPVEAARRCRVARDGRYVAVTPASDGMAHLEARLPAEDAIALNAALNAAARDAKRADVVSGAPARTHHQRRADALAAFAGHANGGAASGRTVIVHVTVPFGTATGLTDEPGELEGYGPIPAETTRALAAEGVWTWLRTDPGTGRLLDLGRTKYRPSKALADFVTTRDRTCRMPGCHRPARGGDIDHLRPFAAGGCTDPTNCHALCETHHLLKHHCRWQVTRDPDGTTRWRSPTGHTYAKPLEAIGPVPSRHPPSGG